LKNDDFLPYFFFEVKFITEAEDFCVFFDESYKYSTRLEFKNNNYIAYKAAHRKKLLNELFKNHKNIGYTRKFKNCK